MPIQILSNNKMERFEHNLHKTVSSLYYEKFEHTKEVIGHCKSKVQQYNGQKKKNKGHTMIYKSLHRNLKIEQHYSHKNILCYTWSYTLFLYLSPVLHLATNRILNFFPCTTLVLQQTFLVTPLYYT